jgi:Ca2+-binding RTX toxin-like protein
VVHALACPDLIFGGSGVDKVFAGRGDDTIRGGPRRDRLFDGQGDDTIYGGLRNDTVFLDKDGTSDTLYCGPGHDVVYGATPGENTIAADCEGVHVMLPHDRGPPAASQDRTARPDR